MHDNGGSLKTCESVEANGALQCKSCGRSMSLMQSPRLCTSTLHNDSDGGAKPWSPRSNSERVAERLMCRHRGAGLQQIPASVAGIGCGGQRVAVHHCGQFGEPVLKQASPNKQAKIKEYVPNYTGRVCLKCEHATATVSRKAGWSFDVESHLREIPYHSVRHDIAAVTCHFNPHASRQRLHCTRQFMRQFPRMGMDLHTIEASYSNRWELPNAKQTMRVDIDPDSVFWHKENLLNIVIKHLPDQYERVLWIDADVLMITPDYADLVSESLDRHTIVQGFSFLRYIDKSGAPQTQWRSAVVKYNDEHGLKESAPEKAYPGLVWAASREVLTKVGGIYDKCITGSGDVALVAAIYGSWAQPHVQRWSRALIEDSERYGRRLRELIDSVGYVEARGVHMYHGSLKRRQYVSRHKPIRDHDFDPNRDLEYAPNGTLKWADHVSLQLREAVREYLRNRKEDD